MQIIKSGIISEAFDHDRSFNGKSGQGWTVKIAKEDKMPGYYVLYKSPVGNEGYDSWCQNMEEVEKLLDQQRKAAGWVIVWDEKGS